MSQMSSSLRERLKKCGRYHPGTPTSQTSTSKAAVAHGCSSSSPHTQSVRRYLGHNMHNVSSSDLDSTPKRKSYLKPVDHTTDSTHADITKRQKIQCDKLASVSDVVPTNTAESHNSISSHPLVPNSGVEHKKATIVKQRHDNNEQSHEPRYDIHAAASGTMNTIPDSDAPNEDCLRLKSLKRQLETELKEKEEQLRKLRMVKLYREKNDLTELQKLINTWRDVSQRGLVDLLDHHPPPKPSMTALIDHIQIDKELLCYNADDESFG